MSLGGESWAGDGDGDIPVPGQGGSAPGSQQVGEQWGVEGQLKAQPQVGETSGSPQRCWCCGTQRLWDGAALGTGAFCCGVGQVWCWSILVMEGGTSRHQLPCWHPAVFLRPAQGYPRADPESVLLLDHLLSVCPSFCLSFLCHSSSLKPK